VTSIWAGIGVIFWTYFFKCVLRNWAGSTWLDKAVDSHRQDNHKQELKHFTENRSRGDDDWIYLVIFLDSFNSYTEHCLLILVLVGYIQYS